MNQEKEQIIDGSKLNFLDRVKNRIYGLRIDYLCNKIEKNPETVNKMMFEDIEACVSKRPELVSRMNEHTVFHLIANSNINKAFIKYIAPALQTRYLTQGDVEGLEFDFKLRDKSREVNTTDIFSSDLCRGIQNFSEEVIFDFFKNTTDNYSLKKIALDKLSKNLQKKLLVLNLDYISNVSDEVAIEYVNSNPLLMQRLPDRLTQTIREENTKKSIIMQEYYQEINANASLDEIIKIGKMYPFRIYMNRGQEHVSNSIIKIFSNLTGEHNDKGIDELIKIIEDDSVSFDFIKLYFGIGIENCNFEEICDFLKNPSHNKLVEIIRRIYGDKSAQILEDRPELTLEHIPNLDIFAPEIIEAFGIGAIHSCLNYNSLIPKALSFIRNSPKSLEKYKVFDAAISDMFNDTVWDLEKKLVAYVNLEHLMDCIDFTCITPEQKNILETIIIDIEGKPPIIDCPKNEFEFETYVNRRNEIFDEAINKETNPEIIKQIIWKRYFGGASNYRGIEFSSIKQVCKIYNLKSFISNSKTIESGNFSEDELDALEILNMLESINDLEILKKICVKLNKYPNIISPLKYKKILDKIPQQYSQVLEDNLLTLEKAEQMVKDGAPGIRIEEDDGIKIIILEGTDFLLHIHSVVTGMSGANALRGKFERGFNSKNWYNVEGGMSTISGSLVNAKTVVRSTISSGIGSYVGFFKDEILAMATADGLATHSPKSMSVGRHDAKSQRGKEFLYPDTFMEEFLNNKAFYNEIISSRYAVNLSEIKEGTHGGKRLPDFLYYMVTQGEGIESVKQKLQQSAKENGIGVAVLVVGDAYLSKGLSKNNEKSSKRITTNANIRRLTPFMKDIMGQESNSFDENIAGQFEQSDILASAVEATETVRTGTINEQGQTIRSIQRDKTQQQDKMNNGINK